MRAISAESVRSFCIMTSIMISIAISRITVMSIEIPKAELIPSIREEGISVGICVVLSVVSVVSSSVWVGGVVAVVSAASFSVVGGGEVVLVVVNLVIAVMVVVAVVGVDMVVHTEFSLWLSEYLISVYAEAKHNVVSFGATPHTAMV